MNACFRIFRQKKSSIDSSKFLVVEVVVFNNPDSMLSIPDLK
jgi:hypothetical protein